MGPQKAKHFRSSMATVAVELGGVDVIHAEFHGAAQERGGRVAVVPEVPQLHRALADACDGAPGYRSGPPGRVLRLQPSASSMGSAPPAPAGG
jgi:hypothetical protein